MKQRAIRTAIVAVTIVVLAAAIYGVAAVTAPAISAVRCQGLRAADARFHEVNRQRMASFIPGSSKVLSDEEKACGIH